MMTFWLRHILAALPLASVFALFYLAGRVSERKWWPTAFYLVAGVGMMTAGWIGVWSTGGDRNALLPSHAFLAILFGMGLARGLELAALPERGARARAILLYLAGMVQFAILVYNPVAEIPTPADRAAGEKLVAAMARYDGDVWLPYHGYLPRMAGKAPFAPEYDYASFEDDSTQRALRAAIDRAVREQRYEAIIYNNYVLPERWQPFYRLQGPLFESTDVFWPVTGYQTRPRAIFVPTRPDPAVAAPPSAP